MIIRVYWLVQKRHNLQTRDYTGSTPRTILIGLSLNLILIEQAQTAVVPPLLPTPSGLG